MAEAFLKFSPRVQFRTTTARSGPETHWLFLDIASTAHLFAHQASHANPSGEERLTLSAICLARDLGFGVQCAVADTPAGAQAFAMSHQPGRVSNADLIIIPPGEERDRLKNLSLPHLLHLEGLEPWAKPALLDSIVTFFMMLGFKTIGDLERFSMNSLQERWGPVGETLWKRFNAQDRQVVSPLLPTEPLEDYVHLDFPLSLTSLLLHEAGKSIDFLFARLQGRRFFASQLVITLHCEYSQAQHRIAIEPNTPSRDQGLFLTLLEDRLSTISLENPIRDFEIHVVPCPEKSRQLDFFEPRVTDGERLQTLLSLFGQSQLPAGLYRIEPAILPEDGWRLAASPEEREKAPQIPLAPSHFVAGDRHPDYLGSGVAIAPQPYYGEAVMRAPRPTRILGEPLPLTLAELEQLTVLSSSPIERFESGWWEDKVVRRDYYFAVSREGECLWVFRDPTTEEYFLHGYFD